MELFLNILWALIALAALGVWRCEWKRHESGARHKPWQQWTAFSCALIFVFFAVSLSDDLHAAAILADDCGLGRQQSLVANRACALHHDGPVVHVSLAPAPTLSFPNPLQVVAQVVPRVGKLKVSFDCNTIDLRGPPNSSF